MIKTKLKRKEKKLPKEVYQKELDEVKEKLPSNYGVIIKHLYPGVNMRKVYNVVNYGVHDEDILVKLKFIIPSEN